MGRAAGRLDSFRSSTTVGFVAVRVLGRPRWLPWARAQISDGRLEGASLRQLRCLLHLRRSPLRGPLRGGSLQLRPRRPRCRSSILGRRGGCRVPPAAAHTGGHRGGSRGRHRGHTRAGHPSDSQNNIIIRTPSAPAAPLIHRAAPAGGVHGKGRPVPGVVVLWRLVRALPEEHAEIAEDARGRGPMVRL